MKTRKSKIISALQKVYATATVYLHCTTVENAKKILKQGFKKKINFLELSETDLLYGLDRMLGALERIPKHRKFVNHFDAEGGEESDELIDELLYRMQNEFGKKPHTLIWVAENEAWNPDKAGAVLQLKSLPKGAFPIFENAQGLGLYVPLASIPPNYFKLFDTKHLDSDGKVKSKKRKRVIETDFKTVKKKFATQGIDIETVKQYLDDFKVLRDRGKINGNEKNIDYWGKKPWVEFKSFVEKSKEEKTKTEEKKIQKTEGAELVYENDEWRIYKILTHEAAMLYGSGTKWCITQPDGKHWRSYVRKGSCFYFMISKYLEKDDKYYKLAAQRVYSEFSRQPYLEPLFWDATDAVHTFEDLQNDNSRTTYGIMPENFGFEWFKIELATKKVDIEDLIERINDHVGRLKEFNTDPKQNDSMVDYLYDSLSNILSGGPPGHRKRRGWDELERDVFNELRESTLEKVKKLFEYSEYSEDDDYQINFRQIIMDSCDVRYASYNSVTNEVASINLGEGEDELDEDFMEEIDSLTEEELKQLERKTPYSDGHVYYGSEYDRFVLVLNENKLDQELNKIEHGT